MVDIVHHKEMKSNDESYPKLPKSIRFRDNLEHLDDKGLKHLGSCLSGFFKRVYNWEQDKLKAILSIKQDKRFSSPLSEYM